MFKKFKYQIIVILALVVGLVVIQSLLKTYQESLRYERLDRLNKVHSDAVIRSDAAINVYAVIVSSLKAYFTNAKEIPTELEVQLFLQNLINGINFDDDILINYIDADHTFQYVITPTEIDPVGLKGVNVRDIRPPQVVKHLDELMLRDDIYLFQPVNLREGWVGLPFNFSIKNSDGKSSGYVTPIINIRYLLDHFYIGNSSDEFVHSFMVNDSIEVTREAFYDDAPIINEKRDSEYFRNFNVDESDFIYSNINLYNLNLKFGSAYKLKPKINKAFTIFTYVWYSLVLLFSLIALFQFIKNKKLTKELSLANHSIEKKNIGLEKNIFKIQTLIKEIHHRVKNNMQMVGNLLVLQQSEYDDPKEISALNEAKNRLHSMSLVHEKLYGSSSLVDVNIKDYLKQLIEFVEDTIGTEDLSPIKKIEIADNLQFDSETMESLGLIINELVTNSYKYAFKPDTSNELGLSISKEKGVYLLRYYDSGTGLPDDFDFENSDSLGMQLIYILAGQLNGHLDYSKENQSTFKVYFKEALNVH